MNIRKILAGVAVAAIPFVGNAASRSFSEPFDPTTVPFGPLTVSLTQFNPGWGTLSGVTLGIEATLQANISAENNTAKPVNATAWIVGDVGALGPSGLAPVISFGSIVAGPVPLAASNGTAGSGPDFTTFGSPLQATGSNSASTVNPLDFTPFVGGSTFDVNYAGDGGWAVFGVSDATVNVSDFKGWGTVTVTYDYMVPEPSQFAVIAGLGLVLFAGARRFRG
ncbi:MAG TPA: choice-of-anchor E domain-containing protein [Candidatus Paceibacterota bacterium]|nr:choice-of-anchor E domain-containing protein [Candidatus Paceibacterota bacterium]HRZ58025.1 choice-of-anchor E domain-containing protein [Candidatus Paceibacterota bacterium]